MKAPVLTVVLNIILFIFKTKGRNGRNKILSPFSIALALSMTQVHRLEEQVNFNENYSLIL